MQMTAEQRLLELYLANIDMIGEGFPVSINAPRRGYMEAFNLISLPGPRDERYRHRDIRSLFERNWEYYFTPVAHPQQPALVEGHRIVIDNGFCVEGSGLKKTIEGAIFGSLRDAATRLEQITLKYYNTAADNDNEAVVALNSAFMQDGAFIYVPQGVKVERPFVVSQLYNSPEEAQACFNRMLIILEKDASVEVVSEHNTIGEGRFLANCVREVFADEGAALELSEAGLMNDHSGLMMNSYTRQSEGSSVRYTGLWNSGAVTYAGGVTDMDGENCSCENHCLYLLSASEKCDIQFKVNHNKSDCNSFQLIKGVVSGQSVGSFTGRVYVAPDAQRTDAQQQSRNLQLSDNARVYTEPQLEIYADDVKCAHGATVGQLEDDSIYYMRQRGISEQDARKLQMAGFVNDVLGRCTNERICEKMRAIALERIEEI